MTREEKIAYLALLEEKNRRDETYQYKHFGEKLYPFQRDLVQSTSNYSQVMLMAANRVGKTMTGTYIDTMHALGHYPDWWDGHTFNHAPLIWLLGYSGEKIRDLLQAPIFGRRIENEWRGGLIPPEYILEHESMTGTPNAMRTVYVRHGGGGDVQYQSSKVQLWSYSQGQHALMGDSVDWYHIDEEPRDQQIFPQVLVRTATGDQGLGGRGILTFTPENGRTELVVQFMDTPSKGQKLITAGWDDAPHLTTEVKETLLASFPVHQRDMRTKGIPMLGHGRIYDLSEDFVTCDPFDIPDHWKVIDGMDFGWDHPQAQIQLAIDMDTETIYVTHAWKQRHVSPNDAWGATKFWSKDVPTAWPLDGLQTEKGSGKQQKAYYKDAGFKMLNEHATWPDGSNGVEAGLFEILDLMRKGKFKVFKGLRVWLDEFLQYHRDEKGRISKTGDDVLDATRYAYMMRRFAISKGLVGKSKTKSPPPPLATRTTLS
ncbi:terminase large subunit domain-containing protein [Acinetobacter silvestris]|uniref:DNA packaging protein n=1 Tax=Acinetobacter silvestris TaxID=1977882 RepID=A0A1Y3CI94_9GAMM|nr:terminase family protein [Acinetobacter silvestris]OTG65827.1 DNA packaging protein [Acinetobacter silvestris]